jgi:hypothetical protein
VCAIKPIPNVIYQTPEEIEEVIKEREAEAALLPPGATRQSVLVDAGTAPVVRRHEASARSTRLIHE